MSSPLPAPLPLCLCYALCPCHALHVCEVVFSLVCLAASDGAGNGDLSCNPPGHHSKATVTATTTTTTTGAVSWPPQPPPDSIGRPILGNIITWEYYDSFGNQPSWAAPGVSS
eukprot:SAG22_NODE_98_length_20720_cov_17.226662_6_plen_113_part_00